MQRSDCDETQRAHNKCGERKKATPTNEMTMKNKEISAQKLCAGTVSEMDTQGGGLLQRTVECLARQLGLAKLLSTTDVVDRLLLSIQYRQS